MNNSPVLYPKLLVPHLLDVNGLFKYLKTEVYSIPNKQESVLVGRLRIEWEIPKSEEALAKMSGYYVTDAQHNYFTKYP